MFFSSGGDGWVSVRSGKPNGRSTFDTLDKGTVKINGFTPEGKAVERSVKFVDGQVIANIFKMEGKVVHHVEYGKFEITHTAKGREITRFNKRTGTGKHGKSRRYQSLLGQDGVCHSWYKQGRLIRQKFIYDNGKTAYNFSLFADSFTLKDHKGKALYEITGALNSNHNAHDGGYSVFAQAMPYWFTESKPFEVKKNGKTIYKGQYANRQKVGHWIDVDGQPYYFQNGLQVPEELYNVPPEKLDPLKILAIKNAQLRMAMCAKIGNERIAKVGKVIHKDGDMRLIKAKGMETCILRVKCPSTKQFYYLNVPHDTTKCEEGRQWTFGVGDSFRKPIIFAKET